MSKKFAVLGFVLLLAFVFLRENMLLVVNAKLANKSNDWSYYYWVSDFFWGLENNKLYFLKWVVSISFTLAIALLTVFSLHVWFKNKNYLKFIINIYLVIFSIVLLIGVLGYLTVGFEVVYPILRRIFGIVHSPLPFIFLFLLFYKKDYDGR